MSDNKKILKENTIRRFMKLANVDAFTDKFIAESSNDEDETTETEATNEELELDFDDDVLEEQDDMDMEDDDDDMGLDDDDDMGMEDDDMGMEDDEMGAADISLTEEEAQLLIDLGERLQAAMGDDEDDDIDDEPMDDEPMDDEPMGDDPMGEEEPGDEPAPGTRSGLAYEQVQADKDAIVQEVLKRVTKRILAARQAK